MSTNWVDEKIKEWEEWNYIPLRISIIPPAVQAGKVLKAFDGDIDRSIDFIKQQQVFDKSFDSFNKDCYWAQVEQAIIENIVHYAILGE